MILADVNVLVYAFDESAGKHDVYRNWLIETLAGTDSFALVDTVLSGFIRIVTNPKIYAEPAPTEDALGFVEFLIDSDQSTWVRSNRSVWSTLSELAEGDAAVRGNRVPDAYLAALTKANDAQLATADRGFARYRGLRWFDPASAQF